MSTITEDIKDSLIKYYQTKQDYGPDFHIIDFVPLEGGRQHRMYSFNILKIENNRKYGQPLVLRLYNGNIAIDNAEYEYRIMEKLRTSVVPVPKVFILEKDKNYIGCPFIVMERIIGENLFNYANRQLAVNISWVESKECKTWVTKLASLLASVHQLDWQVLGFDFLRSGGWSANSIAEVFNSPEVVHMAANNKGLKSLIDWVRERLDEVENTENVMLHFDFHPQNIMVNKGKIVALIDWAEACLGDATFDVAWSKMLFHKTGAGDIVDLFVREYKLCSGRILKDLDFFEVLAACRQLFDLIAVKEGRIVDLNKPAEAAALYDVNKEMAETISYIYQKTGIDIGSIT